MDEDGASSEGVLSSSCSIGEQDGPGCHQTTAARGTTRWKWSQEENREVMQCNYRSEYENGLKKRTE